MRNRAFRPIAAILSVLILAGTPVQAGPVALREVIQVLGSYQNPPDLRLRNVSQNSGIKDSGQSTSSTNDSFNIRDSSIGAPTNGTPDTLLAGVFVKSGEQRTGVDVIAQDDVEGTVCDCGEIAVPGGFPKWPLLFLAAIPFFFIHHGETPIRSRSRSRPQMLRLRLLDQFPNQRRCCCLVLAWRLLERPYAGGMQKES